MASDESKKCAHPVCSCNVTSGKYCSTECEAMEKTPDIALQVPTCRLQGTHRLAGSVQIVIDFYIRNIDSLLLSALLGRSNRRPRSEEFQVLAGVAPIPAD